VKRRNLYSKEFLDGIHGKVKIFFFFLMNLVITYVLVTEFNLMIFYIVKSET